MGIISDTAFLLILLSLCIYLFFFFPTISSLFDITALSTWSLLEFSCLKYVTYAWILHPTVKLVPQGSIPLPYTWLVETKGGDDTFASLVEIGLFIKSHFHAFVVELGTSTKLLNTTFKNRNGGFLLQGWCRFLRQLSMLFISEWLQAFLLNWSRGVNWNLRHKDLWFSVVCVIWTVHFDFMVHLQLL